MDVTLRDLADFYRLALENSNASRQLARVADVVTWVDSLILHTDVPDEWMLDLSMLKTPDSVVIALSHVPPPKTEFLGASIFVAYVNRLWGSGTVSRDDACHLLWNVRDDLRPEHDTASIVPEVTLEDADACFAQGIRDPNPFTRVDEALIEFFSQYEQFDSLIPNVLVAPGG
jgi:hypothetical protein